MSELIQRWPTRQRLLRMQEKRGLVQEIPSDLGVLPAGRPFYVVDVEDGVPPSMGACTVVVDGVSYRVDAEKLRKGVAPEI